VSEAKALLDAFIPLEHLEFQPLGESLARRVRASAIDLRSARFFTVAFGVKTPQAVR